MSLRREDIWADLRYALDELNRRPRGDIHIRLTDAGYLDAQPEDEFYKRLLQIGLLSTAYSKAKMRADTRNAHEAIEKGFKAILIDSGLPEEHMRSRGHQLHRLLADVKQHNPTAFNELERCFDNTIQYLDTRNAHEAIEKGFKAILIDSGLPEEHMRSRGHQLHRLLADVKQHNPTAFNELERCFDNTIQYLEIVTTIQHNTNILEYFRKHGKAEIFVASRYASIEDADSAAEGMIGLVYMEIIRALLSLIFGWAPRDINYRIEEEARKAILAENNRDPAWDGEEWMNRGPVRPRLEGIENLKNNRVLRAALRRCARESKDRAIQFWADKLRRDQVAARRRTRSAHRVG